MSIKEAGLRFFFFLTSNPNASSLFEKRGKDLSVGEKRYAKYAKWESRMSERGHLCQ